MKLEKLELEHTVGYLPYGLKVIYFDDLIGQLDGYTPNDGINPCKILYNGNDNKNINAEMESDIYFRIEDIKPILYRQEDMTTEQLIELHAIKHLYGNDVVDYAINVLKFFYKNHIDIFNLIDSNLAIDIKTIKL